MKTLFAILFAAIFLLRMPVVALAQNFGEEEILVSVTWQNQKRRVAGVVNTECDDIIFPP